MVAILRLRELCANHGVFLWMNLFPTEEGGFCKYGQLDKVSTNIPTTTSPPPEQEIGRHPAESVVFPRIPGTTNP